MKNISEMQLVETKTSDSAAKALSDSGLISLGKRLAPDNKLSEVTKRFKLQDDHDNLILP